MKTYILPLVMFFALMSFIDCHAQPADYDSLKQKILRMDLAINNIHDNMRESHKEFKTGTIMMLLGMAVTGFGAHLAGNNKVEKPTVMYAGLALTGIAGLLHIDSHSWLGRGAWKKRTIYE